MFEIRGPIMSAEVTDAIGCRSDPDRTTAELHAEQPRQHAGKGKAQPDPDDAQRA